jgi:hypothetical protein
MNANVRQCRHLITMSQSIFAGLDDSHSALQPHPGTKTAGWLIGHLAVTGDFGRRLCGRAPLCPREWRTLFNPGSQPSNTPTDYPPMAALCDAFRAVYTDLCDAADAVPPASLTESNPFEPMRTTFPTAGDFVEYLLSGHLAYHLGQLVAWRGAAGLRPMQGTDTMAA